jgi:addiction module RelB/DinJ family antitoxin
MNSTQLNIKIDTDTKKRVQRVANRMGLSLSQMIKAYLRDVVRHETFNISLEKEEPSEYLIRCIKEAERDKEKGRLSPAFDNTEDAIKWLEKPDKPSKRK